METNSDEQPRDLQRNPREEVDNPGADEPGEPLGESETEATEAPDTAPQSTDDQEASLKQAQHED